MGFYKKTIFLKNPKEKGMGLLTIEKTNSGIFGTLKSYDIASVDDMILGISVNGKGFVKQSIFFGNENTYTFKLPNEFDIDANIGCVLVHNQPDTVRPLIWGSNNNKSCFKDDIIEIMKDVKKSRNMCENKRCETKVFNTQREAEKTLDDTSDREHIVEDNAQLFEDTPEEIEKLIDENMEEENFFDLIKDQIDDLFSRFPRNNQLESLVDNSKWVTINYDTVEKDYVVGLLYDEKGNLEFVAYGVPGNIDNKPPSQIIEYSQWLPLDAKNPSGMGYWVMFQDALTGDSVRLRAQDIS